MESDLLKSQSHSQSLQDQIHQLETQISKQSASFAKEKDSLFEQFESTLDTRLKEEKTKWEEESQQALIYPPAPPLSAATPFSPVAGGPFSPHFMSAPTTPFSPHFISSPATSRQSPRVAQKAVSPQQDMGRSRGVGSRTTSYGDLRRPSRMFDSGTQNLTINTLEDEDEREFLREESPRNTVVDAVSVSASTSAAGPSVNIMERMSAAVRRLESDLVAKKEELSRTIKQRDEAREECVNLMSEVEEKRTYQTQVGDWQRKYEELDNRYEYSPPPPQEEVNVGRYNEALLLLGEKSERVEELQMDIVDLKEGYQHALQRLVGGK